MIFFLKFNFRISITIKSTRTVWQVSPTRQPLLTTSLTHGNDRPMANKKTTKEKGSKNILKLTLDPKRHLSHPYPI
jgi:hypothetical protein